MTDLSIIGNLPQPDERRIALRVTLAAERAIRRGHPWLFAEAIRQQSKDGRPGDLAVIFDRKRRFLAVGLYDPLSPIRVRVLQQGQPATIDQDWFWRQLRTAVARRAELAADPQTTGYRLVHGENDGMPGLVVDRYADTLVLKLYTAAWFSHLQSVVASLLDLESAERLVLRLSRHLAAMPEACCGLVDGQVLLGQRPGEPIVFRENGLLFAADVVLGQKTGFFLDQRENRQRVERLVQPGADVLNIFAYTGGFSLYAARAGASIVVSQDISQPALAAALRNFALNSHVPGVAAAEHELLLGDAFIALKDLRRSRRVFDVVVIDPPSFANNQGQVARALSAYGRLVRSGLAVLRPGGALVMCSCSSRVTPSDFYAMVHKAALAVGRPLRELERAGHAVDHPISFPEGEYLKCLLAIVP